MTKRTSLFEEHQKLNGRIVDFHGWELPVQYSGVMDEHLACRTHAGLFDVSHMGEIEVRGSDSLGFLNTLLTNQVEALEIGQAHYQLLCTPEGGVVDDLLVYRRDVDQFLLVVNASNTDKDFEWIQNIWNTKKGTFPAVEIQNLSDSWAQIAIQGPRAVEITEKAAGKSLSEMKAFRFVEFQTGEFLGTSFALVSRTGYTGEDGFEIYLPWNEASQVWRALMETGAPLGLKPCGLGARDTLRLEMRYPLYGQELTDSTLPLEAGLGWAIKLQKEDFIGKQAFIDAKEKGLKRKLVGLKMRDRGIPRTGYVIYDSAGNEKVGEVTSGTQSPSLKEAIGIAYLSLPHSDIGTQVRVEVRGQKLLAEVVKTPFYQKTQGA